jgi:hypothetical protein
MTSKHNTQYQTPIEVVTNEMLAVAEGQYAIVFNKDNGLYEGWNGTEFIGFESNVPVQKTGFFDYNDLGTTASPIVVTSAASPVALTNDGSGSFTNKLFPPAGVSEVYDSVNNAFYWEELSLGDMVDIRLDFDLVTTLKNTEIKVDLHLGTGTDEYKIPFVTEANYKSIGTHTINVYNGVYMGDLNTINNGGQFKITSDKDCSVVVNGWYCKVVRR